MRNVMPPGLIQKLQSPLPRADDHRWLLAAATALSVACIALIAGAGYHAGFHTLNDAGRAIGDPLLATLTQCGDTLFVLSLFLTLAWRYPQMLWHAALAALIATLLSHGIKLATAQMRPPGVLDLQTFRQLGPLWRHDSFPSGHTVTAFVAAGVAACRIPNAALRGVVLLPAAAIAFSRIAVGAHWPADTLSGAAVGLLAAWLALPAMRRWQWGLRRRGHLFLVVALAACAVADLVRPPAYASAEAAVRAVSCISLALLIWHYVIAPTWWREAPPLLDIDSRAP
jgi:membrane-associated phospholipid phosphatase